jgi:adenosylcobinamide-phosphate synthase
VTILVALLALLFERVVGYPRALFRAIGHPVTWFGALISLCDRLNGGRNRRAKGVLTAAMLVVVALGAGFAVTQIAQAIPWGWIAEVLLASTLLAQKELGRSVEAVADALQRGVQSGREAVAHIVGRDTATLDEAAVARAAVETLAESTSDGVVAPLFWLLVAGLPGILVYKAINTADSMIGHRTAKYLEFGWASARLDDLLNWVPARLTAVLIAIAALLIPGADSQRAWMTARRDARKHQSPNSGWPEAAFAGALNFRLGGPRAYEGEVHDLPAFGEGKADLGAAEIRLALDLYWMTMNVMAGALLLGLAIWRLV